MSRRCGRQLIVREPASGLIKARFLIGAMIAGPCLPSGWHLQRGVTRAHALDSFVRAVAGICSGG